MKLSVAGLFVGCGGLDYGFDQAGFEPIWANELNADAAESYKVLIGHDVIVGDIWDIINEVPKTDIIIGGPPCQSFSLVGKRSASDSRGKLVFAFEEIVKRNKPKAFVMENVPGLLASRINGKHLHLILADKFREAGYKVSLLKLIATDYFVPQRRKRVLLVGHRIEHKDFNMISTDEYANILGLKGLVSPISVADALDDLPEPLEKGNKDRNPYTVKPHSSYARFMRSKALASVSLQAMPTMSKLDREFVKHIPPGGNYEDIPDSLATKRIKKFKEKGGRTTTYGRLSPDKPAYTINTYFNRPNVGANYHHRELRLITVREALRLQSFPDHFTPIYKSQRNLHMQIGNAVPPLMARAIAESIKRVLL